MKVKESLAIKFYNQYTLDGSEEDLAIEAYIAGFDKARELAKAVLVDIDKLSQTVQSATRVLISDISWIGEGTVSNKLKKGKKI